MFFWIASSVGSCEHAIEVRKLLLQENYFSYSMAWIMDSYNEFYYLFHHFQFDN